MMDWSQIECNETCPKCGAYTSHIAAFSDDPSVKSHDKAKLKGYYKQWTNGKYLLSCAFYCGLSFSLYHTFKSDAI